MTRDLLSAPAGEREWLQIGGQSGDQVDFNLFNVCQVCKFGEN